MFIDGVHREKLYEVSADGMILCINGNGCLHNTKGQAHGKIIVEANCLYPKENEKPMWPFYEVPQGMFHSP